MSERDSTFIYNQATGFSQCLTKVKDSMKVIQEERVKGKSVSKLQEICEKLAYLTFNQSITQAIAVSMQDLLEVMFINIANVTFLRCDSYLDLLKPKVKFGAVATLRSSPLHMTSLFPENLIAKAEEEISHHNKKCYFSGSKKSDRYHPYHQAGKHKPGTSKKSVILAWKQCS